MNQEQEKNKSGRRALFTGAGISTPKEPVIPESEVSEIINRISSGTDDTPDSFPPIYQPLVNRMLDLAHEIQGSRDEQEVIRHQLQESTLRLADLEADKTRLLSERESNLNDLITSHTEFDRALEIFQYHDIPMVLTGPDYSVHDVNDGFCNLFSLTRSAITTTHPPLSTWVPQEAPTITGPDNQEYLVITLSPPVVPFDHEAVSMILLIKQAPDIPDTNPMDSQDQDLEESLPLHDPSHIQAFQAFLLFPLPAAIINQYHTIILCNDAFCRMVGRTRETVNRRDIGSCGVEFEAPECIDRAFSEDNKQRCAIHISHLDGEERSGQLEFYPLDLSDKSPAVLVTGIFKEEEQETSKSPENQDSTRVFQLLLDLNPSAAALVDGHARVIISNEGFSELTGINPGDLRGTDVRDLGIPVPESAILSTSTEITIISDNFRLQSAWGIQQATGMVIPVGTPEGTGTILILQPEESKSQKIDVLDDQTAKAPVPVPINPVPIPVVHTNTNGIITRVNDAFIHLSGLQEEQVIGRIKDDIFIRDLTDIVRSSFKTGDYRLREIADSNSVDDEEKTFWYFDLTTELQTIADLTDRVSKLEKEIDDIRNSKDFATHSQRADTALDQIDIVEFELNNERYAIDISMVREVVEMLPITPLPRTPPYVIGIINLRGEVTHIIDLSILLGERPKSDRSDQKIIIIPSDVTNGEHIGIIVDNVQSVTEIMGRQVSMLGDNISTQINTHIKGIIKISHDDVIEKHAEEGRQAMLVIWLDIQKILHGIQGSV